MDSIKVVSVIATGLASYLIPTYLTYKKNLEKTTILESNLEFTDEGLEDLLVKTNNSCSNNYVLRRDTICVKSLDKSTIVPKIYTELNKNGLKLPNSNLPLTFSLGFDIVGFYDENSLTEKNKNKKLECKIEALRKKNRYIIALENNTNNVICIGEGDAQNKFYSTLKKRFGYYEELWVFEFLLIGYLSYLIFTKQ